MRIELPARRSFRAAVSLGCGGIVVAYGALFLIHPGRLHPVVQYVGASFAAAFGVYLLSLGMWGLFGREVLEVMTGRVRVTKEVFGLPVRRTDYRADLIVRPEYKPVLARDEATQAFYSPAAVLGFGLGPVCFTYEGQTVRLGESLLADEPAARRIVDAIRHEAESSHES